jgi:hypothetical protein
MSRLKLPKPGFGMRWTPPSAERVILAVENALTEESFVLSVEELLGPLIGDEEYLFVSAALLQPSRNVLARLVVATSSRLIFFDPASGQHLEFPWDRVCRFDVSPSPKTAYDTVGLVWYSGDVPIETRVQSGDRLKPDEIDASFFYMPRTHTFYGFVAESLRQRAVPDAIHRVPPVL